MALRKSIPVIATLFFCNLIILFVGMGLFPILPYYASLFGASRSFVGIYFAVINASLAAGSLLSGYLVIRFTLKKLFIWSGILGVPSLILLGLASSLWQVVVLTSAVWFFGGLSLALISMLVGIISAKESRGRSFSLISLTIPLGAMLGGAGVGNMIQGFGYEPMFIVLGFLWAAIPIAGAFLLPDEKVPVPSIDVSPSGGYKPYRLSEPFTAVLFISLISAVAISFARLGTPLAMQFLAFTPQEVTSTVMVGGLIAIPVVLASSAISDRISRSRALIIAYLFAAAGIFVLGFSSQLWHYWLSASLITISFCLNGALASAVAADVLPPDDLKRGLAWLNGALPAASVVAFAVTGVLTDFFGFQLLFLLAAVLPLAAAALMETALQRCRRALKPQPELVLEKNLWQDNAYLKRCL